MKINLNKTIIYIIVSFLIGFVKRSANGKNVVEYDNESGIYDELASYIKNSAKSKRKMGFV